MPNLSLVFDIVAKDQASDTFRKVGDEAERTGKKAEGGLSSIVGAAKVAGAALLGAGIVSGFRAVYDAAAESARVTALTESAIRSTGGAAKVSAGQVADLAGAISAKTGIDDEAIQSGQNLLLTFCLEESAQALAKGRGWVNHTDLKAGDEILSYDPADDSARWEPVTSMHRFAVDGDLTRWQSKQIDVLTTPAHRWWTVGGSGRAPYTPRFRTTEDISGSQVYVKIGGGEAAGFAGEASYSDDLVELAGWVMTEGWFVKWRDQSRPPRGRFCGTCQEAPARNRAGVPVCDGCAKRPMQAGRTVAGPRVTAETTRATGVGFCQSETANPLEVKRIRMLVDRLRVQGHRISETSSVAARNQSTVIEWHFAGDLGATVRAMLPNKKLTCGFIESLTAAQGRMLFEVLIAADGHVDANGHEQFIQKDAGQLDVVAALAAMLGKRSTVLGRGDALYFPETNRLKGNSVHARSEHYEGTVWCPHLRTGIFLARNRGRTFWTGNTNIRDEAGAGNDIFSQTSQIMADMSTVLGTDAAGSAVQLGKALNDPIAGIGSLSRAGVQFTEQQKEQIRTLVESGDTLGAQKIILAELTTQFGGAAEAAATPLDKMKVSIGNVVEALGSNLIPMIDTFATGAVTAIQGVSDGFSSGEVTADGFEGAMQGVGAVLGDAAAAGGILLDVGKGIFGFFTDLPTPVLLGVAAIAGFAALKGPVSGAMETIALKSLYLRDSVSQVGGVMGSVKGAAGGLVGLLGGPWGIALGGAAAVVGLITSQMADADQKTEDWTQALLDGTTAADGLNEAYLDQFGGKQPGWLGQTAELLGFAGSLEDAEAEARALYDAMNPLQQAQQNVTHDTNQLVDAIDRFGENSPEARQAAELLAESNDRLAGRQDAVTRATDAATAAQEGGATQALTFSEQLDGARAALDETATATDNYKFALDLLTGKTVSQIELEGQLFDAVNAGTGALDGMTGSVLNAAGGLNTQSEAGNAAAEVLLGVRDVANLTDASLAAQGATSDELAASNVAMREAFLNTAESMGITGQDAENLADDILGIPTERTVTVDAELQAARDAIAAFVNQSRTITLNTTVAGSSSRGASNNSTARQAGGLAMGGPVRGPGTGTSDSILGIDEFSGLPTAWVSDSEFVTNALQYSRNPALVEAINAGQIPAGIDPKQLQYLAAGGLASLEHMTIPVRVDTGGAAAGVQAAMAAAAAVEAAAQAASGGTPGGGSAPGGWQSIFNFVKARIPQARQNSTYRPGDPGYHGRGKAVDFGFGSGPGGAGSAGLASINRLLHDELGGSLAELIYDGIGDDRPDLKNGRPLNYGAATSGQHRNHVHAANRRDGGLVELMPSYKTGTTFVPKDGPALLHKGEAVIPAALNAFAADAAAFAAVQDRELDELKVAVTAAVKDGSLSADEADRRIVEANAKAENRRREVLADAETKLVDQQSTDWAAFGLKFEDVMANTTGWLAGSLAAFQDQTAAISEGGAGPAAALPYGYNTGDLDPYGKPLREDEYRDQYGNARLKPYAVRYPEYAQPGVNYYDANRSYSGASAGGGGPIDYDRLAQAVASAVPDLTVNLDGRVVAQAVNRQNALTGARG